MLSTFFGVDGSWNQFDAYGLSTRVSSSSQSSAAAPSSTHRLGLTKMAKRYAVVHQFARQWLCGNDAAETVSCTARR